MFLPGRELLYQLTRKRIREDRLPVRDIWIKREELSFFSLSTHSILSFRRDGTLWFFRECPRLLTGEAYWNEAVEAFFDSLDRLHIDRERFAQEIPIRIRFTQEEIAAFRAYLARRRACGGTRTGPPGGWAFPSGPGRPGTPDFSAPLECLICRRNAGTLPYTSSGIYARRPGICG